MDTKVYGNTKAFCSMACRVQLHRLRKHEREHPTKELLKWAGQTLEIPRNEREVPDILWPKDNSEEIPTLALERLLKLPLPLPIIEWGRSTRFRHMSGLWHFYTHDYRFPRDNVAWQLPNTSCQAIIEPNYSISDRSPLPWARYQIFNKRWLARYWQELGIRVVVDMCVPQRYQELNLMGVPRGWQSYATRGFKRQCEDLEYQFSMAQAHADGNEVLFLVVGGAKKVEKLCDERGWIHITAKEMGEHG